VKIVFPNAVEIEEAKEQRMDEAAAIKQDFNDQEAKNRSTPRFDGPLRHRINLQGKMLGS
jgi:hypothetical protein